MSGANMEPGLLTRFFETRDGLGSGLSDGDKGGHRVVVLQQQMDFHTVLGSPKFAHEKMQMLIVLGQRTGFIPEPELPFSAF